MASAPIATGGAVSIKKHSSRSKKTKHSIADSSALERRSWEAWGQREESIFFDSLVRNSRNWGAIAADIGSKRSEQVRTYYYRVLRKISRLLQAVHFNFDNRDRINTLIALLSYWEAKCETQHEESTIEFAEAIKDRIMRQRQELDTMRSKRHPTPEKLTVQLVPSNEEVAALLSVSGHNPKLQLTLKSKKTMASIVEHLNAKWTAANGGPICDTPLRLYVPDKLGHAGYGVESHDVTIVSVFHSMNCPAICRLEYNWNPHHSKLSGGILMGHEHQELQSTSDEGSEEHSTDSSVPVRPRSASGTTSPSRHSPRGASTSPRPPTALNRLAVPDNARNSSKPLSEDAMDDDAVRHGLLLRKASKVTKTPKSGANAANASVAKHGAASHGHAGGNSFASTRSRTASPPRASSRATRYSTRSRRSNGSSASEMDEPIQDAAYEPSHAPVSSQPAYGSKSYDNMMSSMNVARTGGHQGEISSPGAGAHPGHLNQPMDTLSHFMSMEDDLMSEGSQLASGDGMYAGSDSGVNDLDQLEPLPTAEYGFGGGYVDMPFDDPGNSMSLGNHRGSGSLSSSSNGAHLGIGGLNQQMPTMVVNHHYYQPTWDHSQSYFLGATHQPPMDPYFAAYPTSTPSMMHHQASGQQTTAQSGYTAANGDNAQYFSEYSQYPSGTSSNARSNNYYQFK